MNFASTPSDGSNVGVQWKLLGTIVIKAGQESAVTVSLVPLNGGKVIFDAVVVVPKAYHQNYSWDHRNRLVEVEQLDFTGRLSGEVTHQYDALNRRIATTTEHISRGSGETGSSETVLRFFDDQGVAWETQFQDDGGMQVPKITQAMFNGVMPNEVFSVDAPRTSATTQTAWAFADQQGSVTSWGINRPDGYEVSHLKFSTFGFPEDGYFTSLADNLPIIWAGHRLDMNTGLADMKARWRDTGSGVFLSQDPMGYAAGDSNLYRYAFNSPGNLVDPDGQIVESVWDVVSIFAGLVSTGFDIYKIAKTGEGWGDLGLDVGGLVADVGALFVPFVPGGAGVAIKASRTTKAIAFANQALKANRYTGRAMDLVAASSSAQNAIQGARYANYFANIYQAGQSGANGYEAYLNDDTFGATIGFVGAGLGIGGNVTSGLRDLSRSSKFRVAARLEQMTSARFAQGVNPDLDGPVIAAAYDPLTGAYSTLWRNLTKNESGPELLGALKGRVKYLNGNFADNAVKETAGFAMRSQFGRHGEVLAVNELLAIRVARGLPIDDLTGIMTRVISTKTAGGFPAGSLFRYCENCGSILNETWSISGRKRPNILLPWEWQV